MTRVLVLAILLATLTSTPALACPVLKKAFPPENGRVEAKDVNAVTLIFSDGVLTEKSVMTVTDTKGRRFSAGAPYRQDGAGKKSVSIALKPLPPGTYTVEWDVLCDCDAFTPGSYTFAVTP